MNDLLEMPEVRARLPRVSVAEYHEKVEAGTVGKRMELIRGLIIEKMPKSPLHTYVVTELFKLIETAVGKRLLCRAEQPLTLADSEPEPDVSVVRGNAKQFRSAHPVTAALVVEVAVSSAALDRENASLYAENEVEEYWIVLPLEKQVEIYRRPQAGRYADTLTVGVGKLLRCGSIPALQIDLADLFGDED